MKKVLSIVLVGCAVAAQAAGYEFSNVTLIQRWPWNQLVDVEFDVKQPAGRQSMRLGAHVEVTATVGSVSTVLDAATLSDSYVFGEGRKRLVWNPMTQFAGRDMRNVSLSFRTLEEDVPLGYLVVKIDDGSWWYKPLSFSNEVNTTTYKTTHMAFRYIPATVSSTWLDMTGGTDTVRVGSDGSRKAELGMNDVDVYIEKQATIRLTKGFFFGVFPLTRAQYVGLGGSLCPSAGSPTTPCAGTTRQPAGAGRPIVPLARIPSSGGYAPRRISTLTFLLRNSGNTPIAPVPRANTSSWRAVTSTTRFGNTRHSTATPSSARRNRIPGDSTI